MSDQTQSNHFSPRFSNRYWTDSNGHITKMHRGLDGVIVRDRTTAKKWGCEDHSHSQDIEDEFSKVESRVAPIYKKLVALERLTPSERMIWSFWLLCQFARTPTMKLELAGLHEDLFRVLGIQVDQPWAEVEESLTSLAPHGLEFPKNKELLAFVVLRDWVVLQPADGEFFIKGDTPVVINRPLFEDDAMIVYPLSPTACFVATVFGSFPPSQLQEDLALKPTQTLFYQQLVASKADREIICHPAHYSAELVAAIDPHPGNEQGIHQTLQNPQLVMLPENSDPSSWPFEAFISREDGREYCREARDNGDGTVTVRRFSGGFVEENLPAETVQLKERPWDKAKRWLDLFDKIYGSGVPGSFPPSGQ